MIANVYCYLLLAICSLLIVTDSVCAESSASRWTVKGFGSLAMTGTDSDQVGYYRERSQGQDVTSSASFLTDSRLGLQVDLRLTDSVGAAVQWVARDHVGNFIEQNLDWAFLRWAVSDKLNVRAGRLGTDVFLLSDYRNVGYAYPWVSPPHGSYGNVPFYHFDGLDVTQKIVLGSGYLSAKAFGGYTYNQLVAPTLGIYNQEAVVAGGNLLYEQKNWLAKMSYAFVGIETELPNWALREQLKAPIFSTVWPGIQQLESKFSLKGSSLHYSSIGAAYDDGIWVTQAEASYIHSDTPLFPPQVAGYLSVGRRFSKLTLYTVWGIAETLPNRVAVPKPLLANPYLTGQARAQLKNMADQVDVGLNSNGISEKSISLGGRWDVHPNIALKTQWSHFWLGSKTDNWRLPYNGVFSDTVNVWSVSLDFIF